MANNFNDLLLQTLKQMGLHLDRVEGRLERVDDRLDRILEQKSDKSDLAVTNKRLDAIESKLDQKADKSDVDEIKEKLNVLQSDVREQGQRFDRIEGGIGTLKWVIGAEVALIGVILALLRAC